MAYDVTDQEIIDDIDSSDQPDAIKEAIEEELSESGGSVSVETVDADGDDPVDIDEGVDVVEITGDGTYNADGADVIIVNSDEDTNINYSAEEGDESFVISSGGGDDEITITDDGSESTDAIVEGGAGDDSITGASGDDSISGGDGDDSVDAGVGNDVIGLGGGNDSVEGGAGFDTAIVQGGRSSYNVSVNEDGDIEITDGNGETDTLSGVEFIQFDDGTIIAAVEDQETGAVARLYEAVFDREADGAGLNFWVDNFEQGNVTIEEIAAAFLGSEEDGGQTSGLSDTDFINNLYQIFLEREGDDAGVEFYLGLLQQGVGRDVILADFAGSEEGTDEYDYIQVVGTGNTDFDAT